MSLFEPVYQEGQDVLYLMDQVKDKKNKEENWVQSLALQEAMQRLDERELNIIRLRFFEGKTQTEVAGTGQPIRKKCFKIHAALSVERIKNRFHERSFMEPIFYISIIDYFLIYACVLTLVIP